MKKDAIVVSHLEKSFKVYPDKGSSLKEKLLFLKRNAYDRRQVLKDISFTVSPGEAVALIGRNGCGKSTLLKILTRIIYPDRGEVDYMDVPVRTYSSGMYARLAFAVAIHVSAQVLLIDEILAVGDAAFQRRCFAKMERLKREGATIVLVSHSMEDVARLCPRAIWIDGGLVRMDGPAQTVIGAYLASAQEPGWGQGR